MKSMFKIFAAAVVGAAALTACGGGGDKTPAAAVIPAQPAYKLTETKVGTVGDVAAAGDTVVFNVVGYLYDAAKDGGKGAKVESSVDVGKPRSSTVGVGLLPPGWDMAMVGMKAGGTRTAILPANLAYGTAAFLAQPTVNGNVYAAIPASSPLVYDFEMVSVTKAVIIPSTTITDVVVGTGAVANSGNTASVKYTGWLYDANSPGGKGTQFDSNATSTTTLDVVVDASPLSVITGFNTGIRGMKVGGKRTVVIPSYEAYGAVGSGTIPPNATLVFDIELISVK